MFEMFKKENISYIELLYSDYIKINMRYYDYVKEMIESRDIIANINRNKFLKGIENMSYEKFKNLTHPYPKVQEKIEKFGFDGKQLHHLIRLCEFVNRYVKGEKIKDCYKSKLKQQLINIKNNLNVNGNGYMSLKEAQSLAEMFDKITHAVVEKSLTDVDEINEDGIKLLEDLKYKIIKRRLEDDFKEGGIRG